MPESYWESMDHQRYRAERAERWKAMGRWPTSDREMREAVHADTLRMLDGKITDDELDEAMRQHTITWHEREIDRLRAGEPLTWG
jgi:hypothetical protein